MRSILSQLLAVGPELAAYILTIPLLAAQGASAQFTQTEVSSPNLDLSQLGRVAIGGDFDSISLYTYVGQNENESTNGSQSLLTRYPNGAFQSIGLLDADAIISSMCNFVDTDGKSNGVVVGGNFTSLGGTPAPSIALWDPTTSQVTALEGITGAVNALYCDAASSTVYVGGEFMGGNSTNALAWVTGWVNLPFAGFNGPVESITKNKAGNIVFGGQFSGLGNATTPSQADAQVVNIGGGNITTSGTTTTAEYSDASSIVCSTAESGDSWLLADDTAGWWEGTYGFGFNPTKLRLYNTDQDGRGTKSFYFENLNNGGILNLTYVDPTTGETQSCTRLCPLPENNSTAQDFRFVNTVGVSSFRIYITDWYGSGGGLSGIEIFQDDIYSYAVDEFNEPRCDGITNGSSSTATPNSTWTRVANNGLTAADFLSASLTDASQVSSDTNVIFRPNILQSGNYSVTLYTPGCILDGSCATRGEVNLTASMASSNTPTTTTLYQTNNYDKFDQIYYGSIDVDGFSPSVTLSPVAGQSVPLNVVASRVRFELISSTGGLNGLFEYDPNEASVDSDYASSAIDSAGSALNSKAQINALAIDDDTLYVAGMFSGDGISNFMSVSDNATAVPGGGLNGEVLDMYLNDSKLYLGGAFDNTANNTATGLNNIAVFSTDSKAWSPLGAGVDGAVFYIVPLMLNVTDNNEQDCFALTGNFTSVNAFSGNAAFNTSGFAIWVPSSSNWLTNIADANNALSGELTAWTEVKNMPTVYGGLITSQGLEYSDAVEMVGSGQPTLQSLDITLQQTTSSSSNSNSSSKRKRALAANDSSGQNYTGIYDGIFYHDNNLNITVLGGSFSAKASNGSTLQNLVFVNNTDPDRTVSGVDGIDDDSIFVAMDTYDTLLFAGGVVNGTVNGNDATGLIVYDLSTNSFASPHPPALEGSKVVVNAIASQPDGTDVYVGGSFARAGSLQCATLCAYDASVMQWQNLGTGLSGTINTMLWTSNTQLLIAGDLTVNGNTTMVATYDTKKQTFSVYTGATTLPGPVTAISAVNSRYDEFWVGGIASNNNSAYLSKYADGTWTGASGLGKATSIRKLQIMPLTSNHGSSSLIAENQALMILGNIQIPEQGNASAVLFNGTTYEPYILTSMSDGSQGSLSAIFVSEPQNFISNEHHHLALGLVVLIALAIALGIIFSMVVGGIFWERRRRRKEGYVPMTVDKSTNIARVPPDELFQKLEGKGSPPKL